MSVQSIGWAFAQNVLPDSREDRRSSTKFLLVALANYADADGICWPSIARLAADVCLSERTVQRRLRDLQRAGLIAVHRRHRRNGSDASNEYRLQTQDVGGDSSSPAQAVLPAETPEVSPPEPSGSYELSPPPTSSELALSSRRSSKVAHVGPYWDLFGALAKLESPDGAPLSAAIRRQIGVAAAQIMAAGGTAAEVVERADNYRRHFSGAALTPLALAKWWARCARPPQGPLTGAALTLAQATQLEAAMFA